ncbi:tetratricopeptide repeat protein [Terriglobus roseus]|uniref:Putative negative regulator of RcsB-dependent stress response n=1 Tax=Terriglobus roseus TaxID=392734 RepID=A0A1G7PD22_9BACT|nr:tetratricopeptide repeat protein [Terriglobus roseus]SDF84185.1 Putative negative regulator of RcsB-dependent stress response [Terriglobus roseus]
MDTPNRTRTSPLPVHADASFVTKKTGVLDSLANNRKLALNLAIAVVVVVVVVAAGVLVYNHRSAEAANQLSAAMQTYAAPIRSAENPVPASTRSFGSTDERAKAANAEFKAIADTYGMTDAGRNALYLEGLTALQTGQNASAEELLKKSAGSWNRDISNLAGLALAGLYHQTGRTSDAVAEYNRIIAKPSNLVPSGLAKLQLAEMYDADGKSADAKKIYAEIKDKDPKSAAAELASEKLNGPAAR